MGHGASRLNKTTLTFLNLLTSTVIEKSMANRSYILFFFRTLYDHLPFGVCAGKPCLVCAIYFDRKRIQGPIPSTFPSWKFWPPEFANDQTDSHQEKQIHNYPISNYPISWNCGMIIHDHDVSSQDRYFLSRTSFTYINRHPGFGIFLEYTYKIFNGKSAQNQSKVWMYLQYIIFKQNTQKINSAPCLFLKRIKSIASMYGIFTYIYHISPLKNNHSCM